MPLVELLAPRPGERILDLGCGDGALTARLAELDCEVIGVDADPDMVRAARERGVDARLADGAALPFVREFDAVFSNAALHWMKADPDRVLAGVARALKPGGRFVGEFGGHGNVAAISVALLAALARRGIDGRAVHPWFFPTPQEYRTRLERHGFTVQVIELVPRPTLLPTGMEAWLGVFADPFLVEVPAEDRPSVRKEAITLLEPVLCDTTGNWTADYVRLRFAAVMQLASEK
jgi:SAM-dependent methyltransferase